MSILLVEAFKSEIDQIKTSLKSDVATYELHKQLGVSEITMPDFPAHCSSEAERVGELLDILSDLSDDSGPVAEDDFDTLLNAVLEDGSHGIPGLLDQGGLTLPTCCLDVDHDFETLLYGPIADGQSDNILQCDDAFGLADMLKSFTDAVEDPLDDIDDIDELIVDIQDCMEDLPGNIGGIVVGTDDLSADSELRVRNAFPDLDIIFKDVNKLSESNHSDTEEYSGVLDLLRKLSE